MQRSRPLDQAERLEPEQQRLDLISQRLIDGDALPCGQLRNGHLQDARLEQDLSQQPMGGRVDEMGLAGWAVIEDAFAVLLVPDEIRRRRGAPAWLVRNGVVDRDRPRQK
jgi:hypothetical protein